jgi:hypothetical protein
VVAFRLVAARCSVGLPASRFKRFLRRVGRDQAIAARADEVLPAGLDQGFPHREPVLRLENLYQRPLQLAALKSFCHIGFLAGERF